MNTKHLCNATRRKATDDSESHFAELVGRFRSALSHFPEHRKGLNTQYKIADAALSAFSVFFMQSPSFLAHQRQMKTSKGKSNLETLFQVENTPSDNQIRNLLDPISPAQVNGLFEWVAKSLFERGILESYRAINKTFLIPLDGVHYHSSKEVHCEKCLCRHHKDGTTTYQHAAITPAIVAPGSPHVISLPPEFIEQQDGQTKQDCERNAAKRWLQKHASAYREWGVTILGDDLYACQSLCEAFKTQGLHFILTCKPDSHKGLYQWIEGISKQTIKTERKQGKKHYIDTYCFMNQVPLRDTNDTLMVNWCKLETTDEEGKVLYQNAWITDHEITLENCAEIAACGRARWKIENENNNTLKTKGYHLEHNFGHGKQHLSALLFNLNLLAFLFHTVLHFRDHYYRAIREFLGRRETFFQHIRTLTYYHCFPSWLLLMKFMYEGLELNYTDTG